MQDQRDRLSVIRTVGVVSERSSQCKMKRKTNSPFLVPGLAEGSAKLVSVKASVSTRHRIPQSQSESTLPCSTRSEASKNDRHNLQKS